MKYLIRMLDKFQILKEFFLFFKERKVYWMAPILLLLLLMGFLMVFTEGSVVAPFIYAIF